MQILPLVRVRLVLSTFIYLHFPSISDYYNRLFYIFYTMIKFSYFLQVFLQVIFAQLILSRDIFQLRLADLQSLVTDRQQEARRAIEDVLHRDGAFVSKHHSCQRNFANVFTII